jgi:protein-L-isoaspartate O-methyltransferase
VSISWLSSPIGQGIIQSAREYSDPLNAIPALRKRYAQIDPNLISMAYSQAQMQLRLESRWSESASDLLLTDDGISQATRPEVAKFRSEFVSKKFGAKAHVLDLTCGLGFDSREFARQGLRVTAVEIDSEIADFARHNLKSYGVDVHCADASDYVIPEDVDVVFIDPARRDPNAAKDSKGNTKRIFDPSQWSPTWETINNIAKRYPVVAKVAPGIDKAELSNWDARWVSSDSDLVECFLSSSGTGIRAAVLIDSQQGSSLEVLGDSVTKTQNLGSYLIVPDSALIRASALDPVAQLCNGGLVNEHIAWLTSDDASAVSELANQSPSLANVIKIESHFKFSDKQLAANLKDVAASGVTVMTRGMQLDVEAIRKLAVKATAPGKQELIVAIYRDDAGPHALICRRYLS